MSPGKRRPFGKAWREVKIAVKRVDRTVFAARDGETLFGRHYVPSGEKKGTLLFVHGVDAAPNIEQYKILLHVLAKEGLEVYAVDQRGHGKTKAEFDVDKMQTDIVDVLEIIKRRQVAAGQPTNVMIAGHSMGAVIAAGGLLKAHKQGADIPRVSAFVSYAPPRRLAELEVIKNVLRRFGAIDKLRIPKPLKLIATSAAYALANPRLEPPRKAWNLLRSLTAVRRMKADRLTVRDVSHLQREFERVPNFVETVAKLKERNALPRSIVLLGSQDSLIETNDEQKRAAYKGDLEKQGIRVNVVPFSHIPPSISIAGEHDIFDLSKLIARALVPRHGEK
ncbi:MAG: alpha/beta fold hydrolase [Candidatus Micrarchaeota archaeon]|nr:alpha/beta fold hydrolase [Candidatus Micrarchaeota archaeon]